MKRDRELQERIRSLLEPAIEAEGMELVDLELGGGRARMLLRIYLDGPEGIGIDDCARMSRTLGTLLDVDDPIGGRYVLEVSSPGVNRPLTKPDHFKRFTARRVRVKTRRPIIGKRKNFLGVLERYDDDPPRVTLKLQDGEVTIPLSDIVKANIDFPFDALDLT